ncbi:MAG: 4Fe-4S binding protein, partial [Vicinamibacterales bacterium]
MSLRAPCIASVLPLVVTAWLLTGLMQPLAAGARQEAGASRASGQERTEPSSERSGSAGAPVPPPTVAAPNPDAAPPPDVDGAAPAGAVQEDPWGFDEDEEERKAETWVDILRPQLLDISLTAAFLSLAMLSFFRKSRVLKYTVLVLSVAYLGVVKSQMVSITDVFRLTDMSFPTLRDGVTWYVFTGFAVVSTVLWGRIYCGRICAFGAFTQLMDAVLPKRLRVEPPRWLERRAAWIKYGLLVTTVVYYVTTKHFFVYRYVEPFWMYTRTADVVLWSMLGTLLVATIVVRNLYCRFLCPVGATLGIISTLTVFRIKRWSECSSCKICEKTCEWGAIEGPRIIKTE